MSRILYNIWDKGGDIMSTYAEQIENKIIQTESGKVFIANDFLKIASYETIRKTLNRLVDEKKLSGLSTVFIINQNIVN